MNGGWLWDRSGPRDPEVERLERALAPFAYRPDADETRRADSLRRAGLVAGIAAAAALLLAAAWLSRAGDAPLSPYRLERSSGVARQPQPPRPGDTIVCAPGERARLRVGSIGSVVLESGAALRIEDGFAHAAGDGYRLFLERGSIEARVFAAPRRFQVGTPAGIAVDLGCVYTATVTDSGATLLRVASGAVSFESAGRRVFVPARAECEATPERGPGAPVWQDRDPAYKRAVATLDRGGGATPAAGDALAAVLASDDAADTLSLFHLLDTTRGAARDRILRRIEELVVLPDDVDLAALASEDGDPERAARALDALRAELRWKW